MRKVNNVVPQKSGLVPESFLHVPIECIVGKICLGAREPLDRDGALSDVEIVGAQGPRRAHLPEELFGQFPPEAVRIANRAVVHGTVLFHGTHMGARGHLATRHESRHLSEQPGLRACATAAESAPLRIRKNRLPLWLVTAPPEGGKPRLNMKRGRV